MRSAFFAFLIVSLLQASPLSAEVNPPKQGWFKKAVTTCSALVTLAAAGNILANRLVLDPNNRVSTPGLTTRIRSQRDSMGFVTMIARLLRRKFKPDANKNVDVETQYIDDRNLDSETRWLNTHPNPNLTELQIEKIIYMHRNDQFADGFFYHEGFFANFSIHFSEVGTEIELWSAITGRLLYRGLLRSQEEQEEEDECVSVPIHSQSANLTDTSKACHPSM